MIILSIITYNGIFSLLSTCASLVLAISLWQKNLKIYKLLGIISGTLWILYNIFIFSIVGILLEFALVVFSAMGYIKDKKTKK